MHSPIIQFPMWSLLFPWYLVPRFRLFSSLVTWSEAPKSGYHQLSRPCIWWSNHSRNICHIQTWIFAIINLILSSSRAWGIGIKYVPTLICNVSKDMTHLTLRFITLEPSTPAFIKASIWSSTTSETLSSKLKRFVSNILETCLIDFSL